MSDLVMFRFCYGPGNVRTTDDVVDLSEFAYMDVPLKAPKTWSVSQLKDWLALSFSLNTETHTVDVHALWTRSKRNLAWYLRPIEQDTQWLGWIQECENRDVNPVALLIPVLKEVIAPEGEGAYEPGQSSEGYDLSNVGGDGYETGQSSQARGGDGTDVDESGDADADELYGHMQNLMLDEDIDGDSDHAHDLDDSK